MECIVAIDLLGDQSDITDWSQSARSDCMVITAGLLKAVCGTEVPWLVHGARKFQRNSYFTLVQEI